jgi:hypothetical protein
MINWFRRQLGYCLWWTCYEHCYKIIDKLVKAEGIYMKSIHHDMIKKVEALELRIVKQNETIQRLRQEIRNK